jgi:hypothetical protein
LFFGPRPYPFGTVFSFSKNVVLYKVGKKEDNMLFNMVVGFALLIISGTMFWAGSNRWGAAKIRGFIEKYFLGGKALMDPQARHATEVTFLRWPLLVAAVTTVFPFTQAWQDIVVVLGLTALYYLVLTVKAFWRVVTARAAREEYRLKKLKGETK